MASMRAATGTAVTAVGAPVQPSATALSSASPQGAGSPTGGGAASPIARAHSAAVLSADRDSAAAALEDRRSEVSGAGYSAYSGHRGGIDEPVNYHMRLVRFYQRYNPEKIPRVAEFLEAYKGEEEELFRTLSSKYGPEPEPSVVSVGSNHDSSVMLRRQAGVATLPKIVSKEDGNCSRETPYYPSQRTILEADLCKLLATRKTTHPDLVPCFIGYLPAHPPQAWNGLTYITNVPLPIDEQSRFLGHLWAGSLSNTKSFVYDKVPYTRTVFHCGEHCSTPEFPHERWRMTLMSSEHTGDTMYRVLWDPVLSPAAAAELVKAAPSAVDQDRNSFFSMFWRSQNANKAPPPPPPPAPLHPTAPVAAAAAHVGATAVAAAGAGATAHQLHHAPPQPMAVARATGGAPPPYMYGPSGGGGGGAAAAAVGAPGVGGAIMMPLQPTRQPHFHQPQQPLPANTLETLLNMVQGLEGRVTERLSDLDRRLQAVEQDVVLIREMSEQRQVEQLPEPWLEDGGASSTANLSLRNAAAGARGGSSNGGGAGGGARGRGGVGAGTGVGSLATRTAGERARLLARVRRKQHRRRMESAREGLDDNGERDGTETIQTQTSLGGRSSGYG
jgi:hypothetical protein